jgi:hypothetical protein
MAACHKCGAETELHSNGVPICIPCSDQATQKLNPSNHVHLSLPHE